MKTLIAATAAALLLATPSYAGFLCCYPVTVESSTYSMVLTKLPANGSYADKYDWAKDGQWYSMKPTGSITTTKIVCTFDW